MAAVPFVIIVWPFAGWENPFTKWDATIVSHPGRLLLAAYIVLCWFVGASTLLCRLWNKLFVRRLPKSMRSCSRYLAKISPQDAAQHRQLLLPGNQSLQLEVAQRTIGVPRLPPALNGLKILHLSDFHYTGRVGKDYFREVVRVSNELQPDLIALTGDYADDNAYIDWIPDTLGRLSARYGIYYVMGNHDVFIDTPRLRKAMNESGLVDLGGRWTSLSIGGESIILAGNELPWIAPAADLSRCGPSSAEGGPLRILLAHTPDQIGWARSFKVDLMLCGHTHGGQIRLPFVGAVFEPSRYGVKFDCGLFYLPPTIMHITRGISGKLPLRWNCSPEIVLLTLQSNIV
jgi:predicted MPP superfamily phosphohydrolase